MRKVEIVEPMAICSKCYKEFDLNQKAYLDKDIKCVDCVNNVESEKNI